MDPIVKSDELFDLTGEVALVTGASSGLGERFARVLAAHGAAVVLAARRVDRLDALKSVIEREGGRALVHAFDVAERQNAPVLFEAAEKAFGATTILVNNAGIARAGAALDVTPEDWTSVIDVNLSSVWFLAQEAARRMAAARRPGTIINVASLLGFRVAKGTAAYNVAKAGVIHMTRSLAIELARHDIRVNALAPGYLMSEMTREHLSGPRGERELKNIPLRRFGNPSDLDGAILFLASRAASGFMTGSTVVLDGGQMWSMG
jgi:3-oxoacyl-[acyl-carrier protein] reductase